MAKERTNAGIRLTPSLAPSPVLVLPWRSAAARSSLAPASSAVRARRLERLLKLVTFLTFSPIALAIREAALAEHLAVATAAMCRWRPVIRKE
ncbi:hypothetical protein CONLIGDRAFT_686887 [Coniochaeta ligniaria NRRL 30616]|uniref:Uncharacterized protein n=1 Tax=Coniochaeta ligniaria NRRL 30616 TaxID=1408157 RepID=A0A1J7J1S7_9PEZI|nr:hypothetical protein CONLIGDRAFT_686887 [Coniochaeta ligniaria NRRL 30616]